MFFGFLDLFLVGIGLDDCFYFHFVLVFKNIFCQCQDVCVLPWCNIINTFIEITYSYDRG